MTNEQNEKIFHLTFQYNDSRQDAEGTIVKVPENFLLLVPADHIYPGNVFNRENIE
jgi:hypothetical protein